MSNMFTATVWRQIFRSTWKDFRARFKQILSGLSQHKQLIAEQASLLHFQQSQSDSQKTLLHIQQYEQDRSDNLIRYKQQEEAERNKNFCTVLEWIAAAHTTKHDHDLYCSTRREYRRSGEWILRDERVQNWKECDIPISSVLWLNGIPGAGKLIS